MAISSINVGSYNRGNGTYGTQIKVVIGFSAMAHRLRFKYANGEVVAEGEAKWPSGETKTYKIEDSPSKFIAPFPNSSTGSVTIYYDQKITGLSDWEQSSEHVVTYTIQKNDVTTPTISSFSIESVGASAPYYMKGESQVKATLGASAKCGASISKYSLTVSGSTKESTTSPVTSDALSMSGLLSVTGTVTDSRGFTATKTEDINVLAVRPTLDLVSCKTAYVNGDITCKYTPANDITYSRIRVYYVGANNAKTELTYIDLRQGAGQRSHTFNLSLENLEAVYNAHPDTRNVRLAFNYESYFDSGYKQSLSYTGTGELSLEIPNNDDTKPVITGITCNPSPLIVGDPALYMKGRNAVNVKIGSSGKYKATIKSAVWTLSGNTYKNGDTSSLLSVTGNATIQATVTDSRGFTSTSTTEISIVDYAKPTFNVNIGQYFDDTAEVTYSLANNKFCYIVEVWHGAKCLQSHTFGAGSTAGRIVITSDNLKAIYESLPESTSGSIKYILVVYTDSTYKYIFDNNISKKVTLEIPENEDTRPRIKSFNIVPYDNPSGISVFMNKKSRARVTKTVEGRYGAKISKCRVTFEGRLYDGDADKDIYTGYLASAGSIPVSLTITDTRGFTQTRTDYIDAEDYFTPYVGVGSGESEVVVKRWSYDETEQNNGAGSMLKIVAKKVFASVAGQNNCSLSYQIKAGKDGVWSNPVALSSYEGALEYNGIIEDTGLDAQAVYYVNLLVEDRVDGKIETTFIIPTERVFMDRSRTLGSIAFGGHATEKNAMQVYFDAFFYGDVRIEGDKNNRISLGLASGASTATTGGDSGCFVKRSFDGKVTVSFRCSLTNTNGQKVNKDYIPKEMRPTHDVNAFCAAGQGNYIAACSVTSDGLVKVNYVCNLSSGATVSSVGWVDGYIEYYN